VLADSLYGESGCGFIDVLYELKLDFAVAIRSNHAVWLPQGQTVQCNRWRKLSVFLLMAMSFLHPRNHLWQASRSAILGVDDPQTLPKNSTWCVMTHIENLKYDQVGNLYGLRNWVEWLEAEQE